MALTYDELERVLFYSEDIKIRDKLFLELLRKAKKINLSYIESKFFCTILNRTTYNFGTQADFEVCKEHIFNNLYKTFYKDLSGTSVLKDKWGKVLNEKDKEDGIIKLDSYFFDWEKIILSNQNDNLIKEIRRETKREIKALNNNFKSNNIEDYNSSNEYLLSYKSIVLRSRFLKNIALEHIERYGSPIIIKFNDKNIEFNEFSISHIYFRHYSKVIKQVELNKSFHNEIDYSKIGIELKYILEEIDKSLERNKIDRQIRYRYNSVYYSIWISPEKEKSIEGISGMIKFYQIETFHPLTENHEIEKIKKLHSKKISEQLEFYY